MNRLLRSRLFWTPFVLTLILTSAFFAWQLDLLQMLIPALPVLPRTPATPIDIFFTILLGLLLSLTAGLIVWNTREGSCPRGTKRATGVAGILGAITLFCPVCLVLPASFLGIGVIMTFLTSFLPLLRLVAVIVLIAAVWMMRPRR